jgi:1-acyl-sn-glycerol-3-phosphate acyltransferase
VIAWLIRMITGAHGRWVGVTPTDAGGAIRQRVYFANHTSNLDAPVIWAALPRALRKRTRPVAARDYWEGDPIRRFLAHNVFRAVLIERKKVAPSCNPLRDMEAVLSDGDSLIIFPEGARFADDDGEMAQFKPGLWHLARKHPEVEFVPVHLENLNRILPKGDLLFVPLLASVTFGAAVQLKDGEEKRAFLDRARAAVATLEAR